MCNGTTSKIKRRTGMGCVREMESSLLCSGNTGLQECHSNESAQPRAKAVTGLERPKVIAAIPAFNEEIAIGSIVLRARKYADEVVVVNDGSTDHTADVVGLAGAEMIVHEKNSGYGAAIKTCFCAAREKNADVMIIIDADGQHDPEDIPRLIAETLTSGSDIVIGSRFVNGNGKNQKIPMYRKFGMKVLDVATNAGTGLKVSDSQSGFRAYSRNAINNLNLENADMGIGSEILFKAAENNLKITEVPIKVRYDLENTSSKNPISHGFGALNYIISLTSRRRPVLLFRLPGTAMIGIGTVCAFMFISAFSLTHSLAVEFGLGAILFILPGVLLVSTRLTLSSVQSMITRLSSLILFER